jgi:hypothetical protein
MAQAVRQATVGRAKYERLGVIKEADACGVRVSLNGDSLALKASAKHRRREGSDQGVHPYVPVLGTPVCTGFPAEIGRWRDRRRRPARQRSARAMADLFDLKWLLRKSKPGTMGQNRPAPKVDDLKSAGCVVSPPNPALLCYLLT